MWTRSELKEKAKAYVKRSYWPLVLVSLILAVITGGFSNGGNSGRDYSTDWSGGVDVISQAGSQETSQGLTGHL